MTEALTLAPGKVTLPQLRRIAAGGVEVALDPSCDAGIAAAHPSRCSAASTIDARRERSTAASSSEAATDVIANADVPKQFADDGFRIAVVG